MKSQTQVLNRIHFQIQFLFLKEKLTIHANDNSQHSYSRDYTYQSLPQSMKMNKKNMNMNMDFLFKQIHFTINSINKNRIRLKQNSSNGKIGMDYKSSSSSPFKKVQTQLSQSNQQKDQNQKIFQFQFDHEFQLHMNKINSFKAQTKQQLHILNKKIDQIENHFGRRLQQISCQLFQKVEKIEYKLQQQFGQRAEKRMFQISQQVFQQRTNAIYKDIEQIKVELKKFIKRRKPDNNKINTIKKQQRYLKIRIFNFQQASIDGFHCQFYLQEKNSLHISIISRHTLKKYQAKINSQHLIQLHSFLQDPQMLFKQLAHLIQNQKFKQRISIESIQNGTMILNLKMLFQFQSKLKEISYKFQLKLVQLDEIERLQELIYLNFKKQQEQKVELQKSLKQMVKQEIKQLKQWTLAQLKRQNQNKQYQNQNSSQGHCHCHCKHQRHRHVQSQIKQTKQLIKEVKLQNKFKSKCNQNKCKHQQKQKNDIKLEQHNNFSQQSFGSRVIEVVQNSSIFQSEEDYYKLLQLFPRKVRSINLLFKASQHVFSAGKFHQICDNIPNTITLIKTQFNKVIGGYTNLKWDKSVSRYSDDTSLMSFVFSLTNGDVFSNLGTGYSIYNAPGYGPTFGNHDIHICNLSNANDSSYSDIGLTYSNFKYPKNNIQTIRRFAGNQQGNHFRTQQYEVYEVVFYQQ